jgi:hypothetical protein
MDTYGRISTPDLTTKPEANYGELVEFWNKGNAKIVELQEEVDNLSKSRSSIVDTKIYLERQIESFMDALMQFVVYGEIEEAVGEELAGYFNRDLTRKVSVRIFAEGDVELVLPIGFDIDDIEGSLGVLIDTIGSDVIDVEYEDMSITSVEVQ